MKKVINSEALPIKLWLEDIEDGALEQAKNLANLPFAFKHISIMPDSHQGYGMPIGGVLATKGVVVSNAVGVDIGCGVCAARTNVTEIERDTLKKIMGEIRGIVPMGFNSHPVKQDPSLMPPVLSVSGMLNTHLERAATQIGTLGGGNHFIEIQKGSDGFIWLMIHSGSRNLGKQVADYYNELADELNERWHSSIPHSWELAFLPINTQEGRAYLSDMKYCVEFASANRGLMMERVLDIVGSHTKGLSHDIFDIAHNYAAFENHFGQNVIVHRKGATKAEEGQLGIIPGSQGTKSYIVKGKGNHESFKSCSHGAGRRMGRKQAERTLDLNVEIERMNAQGIIHGIRGVEDLDEAPGAYKDIDVVMKNQEDLVEIVCELTPLAVLKG